MSGRLRAFATGSLAAIAEFFVEDRCIVCRGASSGPGRVDGYRAAVAAPVRAGVRLLPLFNHPLCQSCAARIIVARAPGHLGRVGPAGIRTANGTLFSSGEVPAVASTTVPIYAPFMTCDPVLELVRSSKFHGYRALLESFASAMAAYHHDHCVGRTQRLVVPVPMFGGDVRRRGGNHTEILAGHFAVKTGIRLTINCLWKTTRTRRQSDTPQAARAANVRGVFEASAKVAGRHVVLIDDLATSGATAAACSAALLARGAAAVEVACLARSL